MKMCVKWIGKVSKQLKFTLVSCNFDKPKTLWANMLMFSELKSCMSFIVASSFFIILFELELSTIN